MEREDWNRRYRGEELVWTAEPNRFLVAETDTLPPGRALDLAAGEGRNAVWLAERGWRVDAVDFSDVALDKARRLARARGVRVAWRLADLRDFVPRDSAYDLVVLLYLHLPWVSMRPILDRAARAVAPRGTLLLVGHDRSNLTDGVGGPQSAEVLYTAPEVANALGRLVVREAGTRTREVETEAGPRAALDCLVRATRGTGG